MSSKEAKAMSLYAPSYVLLLRNLGRQLALMMSREQCNDEEG